MCAAGRKSGTPTNDTGNRRTKKGNEQINSKSEYLQLDFCIQTRTRYRRFLCVSGSWVGGRMAQWPLAIDKAEAFISINANGLVCAVHVYASQQHIARQRSQSYSPVVTHYTGAINNLHTSPASN